MKDGSAWWKEWTNDSVLHRILRNTGYMLSGNILTTGMAAVQSILAARILGIELFGVLGIVTSFASTVNRLFSFRMGELVVKYLGAALAEDDKSRGAAIVKLAGLAEGITSLITFLALVLVAPLAARYLAKDVSFSSIFIFYGIFILGNIVNETSTGILQVGGHFRSQAAINVTSSVLTLAITLVALLTGGGLTIVVSAYLCGKLVTGLGIMVLAWIRVGQILGQGWWRVSFSHLPPLRELLKFAFSTNISQTVIMLVRDSELLWISLFLSPVEAGYYKTAQALVNVVLIPTSLFIGTTFPEIAKTVAERNWNRLKGLLRHITTITFSMTVAIGLFVALFGNFLLLFYGVEYLPALPAVLVLIVGLGFSNVFFWNRPLLLSLGLPEVPFRMSLLFGAAKIGLAFLLVPRFGFVMEAALLTLFSIFSVGSIVIRGLREIHVRERLTVEAAL